MQIQQIQRAFHYDHDALLRINAEGIGYLSIPAISVQLPVAQGTDNDYYLTHTFDRKTNGAWNAIRGLPDHRWPCIITCHHLWT